MFKLKNGQLRTVIYNKADLDLYFQAGWSLVEDKKEETKEEIIKESKAKGKKVNEQSSSKRNTIK